ncbi:DUF3622 domain-containing protein [Psychromonas sp. KJ10-2]|uniref:DUF3622 domain-containing protein n=1 Tax=Psychromonas sp. KJ10-2 TaxID=3391822 RepID=UPI0039B4178D
MTRRVSARRSNVSKQQDGFATEALAIEWAEKELEGFLTKQKKPMHVNQNAVQSVTHKLKKQLQPKKPQMLHS